jgi:hypothetical protein
VPGGPTSSNQIGPPSGSTVMSNRRNRQDCRSASTVSKIVDSASAGSLRRIPAVVSSLLSARPTRPGSSLAGRDSGRFQRANDRQVDDPVAVFGSLQNRPTLSC